MAPMVQPRKRIAPCVAACAACRLCVASTKALQRQGTSPARRAPAAHVAHAPRAPCSVASFGSLGMCRTTPASELSPNRVTLRAAQDLHALDVREVRPLIARGKYYTSDGRIEDRIGLANAADHEHLCQRGDPAALDQEAAIGLRQVACRGERLALDVIAADVAVTTTSRKAARCYAPGRRHRPQPPRLARCPRHLLAAMGPTALAHGAPGGGLR